jgi:hypothetical protein
MEDESRDEWRPSMAGRPKIGGRLATFSLLSSLPLHYLPPFLLTPPLSPYLAQPPHLWDKV